MNYIVEFEGQQLTPAGTVTVPDAAAHNRELAAAELAQWQTQPDRQCAYYHFGEGITGRELEVRRGPAYFGADCTVSLWNGETIGRIISARVYRHNFTYGGRMVSLRVIGSNGATYYGRASYDNGDVVVLRKARS
jgi:hypothetical protein